MNELKRLLELAESDKRKRGLLFTPSEIFHQPKMWKDALAILERKRESLLSFLEKGGLYGSKKSVGILTGAGSSEFVGSAVCNLLREELRREVISIPTTDLVTHAQKILDADESYVLISFARSGNSPESLASYNLVKRHLPEAQHLIITCNRDGALAKKADGDGNSFSLLLPEGTHDKSLVMTSSFSTMAWMASAVAYLDRMDELAAITSLLTSAAERILGLYPDLLAEFSSRKFSRACFLGSSTLYGTMKECKLKMLEMTDGKIASICESFLGLRHGPQVFVNSDCIVVASIASEQSVRRYELDMLRELKSKGQGQAILVICDQETPEIREVSDYIIELSPGENAVPDPFRILTDVIVGQLLATFKSIALGLKPDCPSSSGVINRVVQGVVIYD